MTTSKGKSDAFAKERLKVHYDTKHKIQLVSVGEA